MPIDWLGKFKAKHGRALRVLHVGNIANNAYNNAKIQRRYGIEADVLCHDYYHIMSCPEWEDAHFEGDVGDQNFPDWWNVKLGAFKRPAWFVQGHLDPCIRLLIAQRTSSWAMTIVHRWLCEFDRWTLCCRSVCASKVRLWIKQKTDRDIAYLAAPANPLVARYLAEVIKSIRARSLSKYLLIAKSLSGIQRTLENYAQTGNFWDDRQAHMIALSANKHWILQTAEKLLTPLGHTLTEHDLEWFFEWWWHPRLGELFNYYDVIQAYGTLPAMPLINSDRPYIAYEHGTIRSIPFEDSIHSKMCALSYRSAAAVFVTNSDNIEAANRLGIETQRLVFLPHAFDSDKLGQFADSYSGEQPNCAGPCVFFSPSRQDWQDGDPSWAKGNDRFFRAAAKMQENGADFMIFLVAWGRHLAASRTLIHELGLEPRVQWLPPMRKQELWQQYMKSHCVVDQFLIPAIGGVTFEAMALGRRVITAMHAEQTRRFFGETPPVHAATTEEEIVTCMQDVLRDINDNAGLGRENRCWIARYHSAKRIVELQAESYRRLIEPMSTTGT